MSKLFARFWPLLIALGLVLFPYGWLGEVWPPMALFINTFFENARQHAIGHAAIFFMFGCLLLMCVPELHKRVWWYLGLMAVAGISQELFQAVSYKSDAIDWFDNIRDISTDLVGAIAALIVMGNLRRLRQMIN